MVEHSAKKVAILGAGNMGEAIARGLLRSVSAKSGCAVIACDKLPERLKALQSELLGLQIEQNPALAVQHADILFIATKPGDVHPLMLDIRAELSKKKDAPLIVSVAAGIRMAELKFLAGDGSRVVRAMPNLPATIGAGINAVYAENNPDFELARELLSSIGEVVRLSSESQIDAATALSGSGPGYVCLVLEALADGGVKCGLSREVAQKLAIGMLGGTAKYLDKNGLHPAVLRDRVASPGGTTIAGLVELEKGAVRSSFISAIEAATARAVELGKGHGSSLKSDPTHRK